MKQQSHGWSVLASLLAVSLQHSPAIAEVQCQSGIGDVARALFTTQVLDREPTDQVLVLENKARELYFFTDLRQFEGHEITHRWEYDGKVMLEKSFEVKGPRWRVYSRNDLPAEALGRWTVLVVDEKGCAHKAVVFEYIQESAEGPGSAIISLPAATAN